MNTEKSTLQKLKNKARSKGIPFQLMLQLFCQEEFLRRLERSEYHDRLILKGGLFLFSYSGFESRPTMDIDFLALNLSNDQEDMKKIIQTVSHVITENSYIIFKIKSLENISEMKFYHGLRIKMLAQISNTNTPFDIDIGFGDIVVPSVNEIDISTQLDGFLSPKISSYSLESAIADKLEIIFDRMEATSRMKDYYDLFYLASHYDFDSSILIDAISQTFTNRGTACNTLTLQNLSLFYKDTAMISRWNVFASKILAVSLDFQIVIELIIQFADPLIHAIEEGKEFQKKWSCENRLYI